MGEDVKWDLSAVYWGLFSSILPFILLFVVVVIVMVYNVKNSRELNRVLEEIQELKKKF
ncbi:hypothetical protein [Bacillus sp. 3255]|uniref:hypothetical protein n=1 Tax=Bacillus sp. 3255 TaxID=2817904 RepID=UPI00285E3164|nr:hypothetical protein [Bacillus sp. 3255]MDR6884292.1 hypothetical protein [Bacillus sp. 3255]